MIIGRRLMLFVVNRAVSVPPISNTLLYRHHPSAAFGNFRFLVTTTLTSPSTTTNTNTNIKTVNMSTSISSSSQNEAPPPNVINFACGHPDATLLPTQLIVDATQRALLLQDGSGGNGSRWLQYGRENGNYQARQAIAQFLSTELHYGGHQRRSSNNNNNKTIANNRVVDPDSLCLTNGVSHGIQLVVRTLNRMHMQHQQDQDQEDSSSVSSKPLCFVEDPSYFLVPPILRQSGYDVQAVRTNPDTGLDLQSLEQQFQRERERGSQTTNSHRLMVLYCIPTHHNPLGVSLSNTARSTLIKLCETYNVYLIADEVYHGLTFPSRDDTTELIPMIDVRQTPDQSTTASSSSWSSSNSQLVISVSAFTKILCPGIRCGWIHTHNRPLLDAIRQDGVLDSGGCSSQLSTGIVRQLILDGSLTSYLQDLQTEYNARCQHLCTLLDEVSNDDQYPFQFEFVRPHGGYFVWVRVTGFTFAMDVPNFRQFCLQQYDVDFKTGTSCSSSSSITSKTSTPIPLTSTSQDCRSIDSNNQQDDKMRSYIRLCFAYYNKGALTEGVQRLSKAIHDYSKNHQV